MISKITEQNKNLKLGFFGGEPLGTPVLEILLAHGITPQLVVCNPDRPSGRGHTLTPPPIKELAAQHHIPVLQPERLKTPGDIPTISNQQWDLFVVVAYNKILPSWLIDVPTHKTINLHPSHLPKLRGASPIRTAILEDQPEHIGASIMLMDEAMDHGPILAYETLPIEADAWPLPGGELDRRLAQRGGDLLVATIPQWLGDGITPQEQLHDEATYTKKLTKEMGQLEIDPDHLPTGEAARQILLKIRAFDGWPGTYFFYNGQRIKITNAELTPQGELRIVTIIPEGKAEMKFDDWLERK